MDLSGPVCYTDTGLYNRKCASQTFYCQELSPWSKEYRFQLENAADQVVVFGNPCTMQIIIEHWGNVVLRSNSKRKNAPVVFDLTGVEGYKGKKEQCQELFSGITKENYQELRERIKKLQNDDAVEGSTNLGRFLENAAIFEVHQMMLEDDDYLESIQNMIQTELVNAEYAVAVTGDNFSEMFAGMDDDYMKARAADVKDISNRLVKILQGRKRQTSLPWTHQSSLRTI